MHLKTCGPLHQEVGHKCGAGWLFQQPDIVVGLPENVVGQQGQDDAADLALLDPLGPGGLEVPEPAGFFQRIGGDGSVLGLAAGLQQGAILLGKVVG